MKYKHLMYFLFVFKHYSMMFVKFQPQHLTHFNLLRWKKILYSMLF